MDVHPIPTPFPANKPQSMKSKYKKISEAPKQKIQEAPIQNQRQRRTFGTIRNPNIPAKTMPEKPKAKTSNQISVKQPKTEPEIVPVPKIESAKKTPQNGSNEKAKVRKKKKSVSFPEKLEESIRKRSPAGEVKTPVRPPFTVKPIRIPGTPYLSAETCSSCRFDRLETASYWLGQIKSAESVGKHFVSAAFFRLANDCKAQPTRTLLVELKKYLSRYDHLCTKTEWKEVSRMYGILKKERETESNGDKLNLFSEEMGTEGGITDDTKQRIEEDDDIVKEIFVQES